jgi:hypothetical protein
MSCIIYKRCVQVAPTIQLKEIQSLVKNTGRTSMFRRRLKARQRSFARNVVKFCLYFSGMIVLSLPLAQNYSTVRINILVLHL